MKYITHLRYTGKSLFSSKNLNIPALTEIDEHDGYLYYNGNAVCTTTSFNAHRHFVPNDDNIGILKAKLLKAIEKTLRYDQLHNAGEKYQARWDKVWDDEVCQPLRKQNLGSDWIWNHEFYVAPIDTLLYIANLVGAKIPKEVKQYVSNCSV